MAHVLLVSAGELGHPIAFGILVEADDRSLRHRHDGRGEYIGR